MGDKPGIRKFVVACLAAAAAAALAATVAPAQGPDDYEPPGLPAPPDSRVDFRAKAKAGKLKGYVKVTVRCEERCWVRGRGRVRLTKIPGARKGGARFRLGRDRSNSPAAGELKLRLKVPKFARRQANAKSFDGKATAKLVIKGRDASGNVDRDRLRVRFRN
jgi:hypothetical protein